jgi:hypothetical protein
MKMDRRGFTKRLAAALALPTWATKASAAALAADRVTKIRCYYPPNYQSNGPQATPKRPVRRLTILADITSAREILRPTEYVGYSTTFHGPGTPNRITLTSRSSAQRSCCPRDRSFRLLAVEI